MKDVAREAGVSVATVSYVINGTKPVNPDTRQRVLDAIDHLHYRPNQMARSLKTQRTGLVGVLIPDLFNSYFTRMVAHIEEGLYGEGYQTVLCVSQGRLAREQQFLTALSRQLEGIIIAPAESATSGLFTRWDRVTCPLVFVDRRPTPMDLAPYVVSDDERAGRDVFYHLQSRYEELAVIGPHPAQGSIHERIAGFVSAALSNARSVQQSRGPAEDGRVAGQRQMAEIMQRSKQPIGVYCVTGQVALGCVSFLKTEGVSIGRRVGIVGHDDADWMSLTDAPITAVRSDPEWLGRRAVALLMNQIKGLDSPGSVSAPAQLIVRASSLP